MRISEKAAVSWGTGISTNADSSAGYVSLGSNVAREVTIINDTGTTIEVVNGTTGTGLLLITANRLTIPLVNNISEVGWRRSDEAATSVAISYIWTL